MTALASWAFLITVVLVVLGVIALAHGHDPTSRPQPTRPRTTRRHHRRRPGRVRAR